MANWWPTFGVGFAAVLVLFAPGAFTAFASGLRGLAMWGVAPLFTAGIFGVSAIALNFAHIPWTWWSAVVMSGVFAALAYGIRHVTGRWRQPSTTTAHQRRILLWTAAPVAVISTVWAFTRLAGHVAPGNIQQATDTTYHLNNIARMVATGNGSSLHMTLATPGKSMNYYPAAWHDIVTIVIKLTGTSVPVAANWVNVCVAFVVWPVALLTMARVIFGPDPFVLTGVAALSLLIPQFPMGLFEYGGFYPNLMSTANVPALVALALILARQAEGRHRIIVSAVAALGVVSMALTEPNGFFTALCVLTPLAVWIIARWTLSFRRSGRPWWIVLAPAGGVIAGVVVVWFATDQFGQIRNMRTQLGVQWGWPLWSSLRQAMTFSLVTPASRPAWLVVVLGIVGIGACFVRRKHRWLAFSWALLVLSCVAATSLSTADGAFLGRWLKGNLIGYWYADPVRLAADLTIIAIPLAAVGLSVVVKVLMSETRIVARRSGEVFSPDRLRSAAIVAFVLVGVYSQASILQTNKGYVTAGDRYSAVVNTVKTPCSWSTTSSGCTSAGTLLTADERDFIENDVAKIVPKNAVIIGNPYTGASLTWALIGRQALYPTFNMIMRPQDWVIPFSLKDAKTNPAVCEAVRRTHAYYVLDFGSKQIYGGYSNSWSGLDLTGTTGVAKVVATRISLVSHQTAAISTPQGVQPATSQTSVGELTLWQITACGPVVPSPPHFTDPLGPTIHS